LLQIKIKYKKGGYYPRFYWIQHPVMLYPLIFSLGECIARNISVELIMPLGLIIDISGIAFPVSNGDVFKTELASRGS